MTQQYDEKDTNSADRDDHEALERAREWGAVDHPILAGGSGPTDQPRPRPSVRSHDVTRCERPDGHSVVEIGLDDIADADDVRP